MLNRPLFGHGGEHQEETLAEQLLRVLRRRKWIFLQALIAVPLIVGILTSQQAKQYDATATLLMRDVLREVLSQDTSFRDPNRTAATNEELIGLPVIADQAAARLGDGVNGEDVGDAVSVTSPGDADVLEIQARTESPALSARMANAYALAYIDFRRDADAAQVRTAIDVVEQNLAALPPEQRDGTEGERLTRRLETLETAESLQTGNAVVVQRATPPEGAAAPSMKRNIALGIVLGAALGIALASLLERLDRRIKTIEGLERTFGLPVIARVPRSGFFARARRDMGNVLAIGPEAESFRMLRANLRFFAADRPLDSLLIVSPKSGDGKSTAARFLAMTMAYMGDNVIYVEADLHKPGIGAALAGNRGAGLSTVLAGGALDDALKEIPVAIPDRPDIDRRLTVLPAGPLPPNPSELLESERMEELLERLRARFDLVIIDTPPLSEVSDALALVPYVAGVLIVSRLGHTTYDSAGQLRKQLALSGHGAFGVVANYAPVERSSYYYDHATAIEG